MEKFVEIGLKSFLRVVWDENVVYVIVMKECYDRYGKFVKRLESLSYLIKIER